jgi:hypothetical protein
MHRLRNRKTVHPMYLIALLGAIVVGCSSMPTRPEVESTPAATTVTTPTGRAADGEALLGDLVGGITDLLEGLIVRTLNLVGSLGGTVSNGRFKVVIPPDAVAGNATVAIGVESSTSAVGQLEILPAEKNHFLKPVVLTIDCSRVTSTDLKNWVVLLWDPAKGRWVPVPGSKVDLKKKTISAPLYHFSRYTVGTREGKAGW